MIERRYHRLQSLWRPSRKRRQYPVLSLIKDRSSIGSPLKTQNWTQS
jgi:hypothetical protein